MSPPRRPPACGVRDDKTRREQGSPGDSPRRSATLPRSVPAPPRRSVGGRRPRGARNRPSCAARADRPPWRGRPAIRQAAGADRSPRALPYKAPSSRGWAANRPAFSVRAGPPAGKAAAGRNAFPIPPAAAKRPAATRPRRRDRPGPDRPLPKAARAAVRFRPAVRRSPSRLARRGSSGDRRPRAMLSAACWPSSLRMVSSSRPEANSRPSASVTRTFIRNSAARRSA